jgi:hypothetical protein
MIIDAEYICAVCGEVNSTTVDTEGGNAQHYTEDCFVCCHPNALHIFIDPETDTAIIQARFEE